MKSAPTILALMSLPAGAVGYAVGVAVVSALPLPAAAQELLVVFAPLFVAGLFMLPFLVPFFDRMAKRDLAAHRERMGSPAEDDSGGEPGPDRD